MDIVDFLLRNWYLLFIVYGIITAIRAKRKAADGSKGTPKGGMPPFGGSGFPVPGAGRAGRKEKGGQAASASAGVTQAEPERAAAVKPQARRAAAPVSSASSADPSPEEPLSLFPDDRDTSKELVRGIIWSEVIGPPRAKKPYNPKR